MKTMVILIGMALSAAGNDATAASNADSLFLENQSLRMEICRTPAPFIRRLVHKASDRAVVAEPATKSLFSIAFANEDGKQETIESAAAGASDVRVTRTGAVSTTVIKYAKFPASDVAVEVTAVCDEQDPLTRWTIRVTHNPKWRLKTVRFPQLWAVPAIDDGKDDCLVLPALAGTLIENPAENWRNGQSVALKYPGNLSAQFLAYQDRSAGVYLAGMDTAGYPMSLGVSKQAEGFRCWHEFTTVADEKEFRPGVSRGDWRDAGHVVRHGRSIQAVGRTAEMVRADAV